MTSLNKLQKPLVIGHRGLADDNVENTLEAVQNASQVCDVIEVDVRQLRDGAYVVFHDDTLERATGQMLPLSDATYETIAGLQIFDSQSTIPTIDEVLRESTVPLLVEIKSVQRLEPLVQRCKTASQSIMFQSFHPSVVRRLIELTHTIPVGLLCAANSHIGTEGIPDSVVTNPLSAIDFVENLYGDFVAIPYELLTESIIEKAEARNIDVFVWDVKSKKAYNSVTELDGDGIVIDSISIARD